MRNQIHSRDPYDMGNPNLRSAGTSMTTPNFTKINLTNSCCDLFELRSWSDVVETYFVFFLSFCYCPKNWSTVVSPSNFKSNIKSKQQQRLLIRVKLRLAMGDQTELTIEFLAVRWSRGCAWFCTAILAVLITK